MPVQALHDPKQIEGVLRRNTLLHLYELGDLDPFFWPFTQWYGLIEQNSLQAVALVYGAYSPLIVVLLTDDLQLGERFLHELRPFLPRAFYSMISVEAQSVLAEYEAVPHGLFHRLGLHDRALAAQYASDGARVLLPSDAPAVQRLYHEAYPQVHFDPRTLETGQVYGIERDGQLVTIAGVHVFSRSLSVAALGNVTTHPLYRGQGLAVQVCAAACQGLLAAGIEHIGLNVRSDNTAALALYRRLGFTRVADFYETTFSLRGLG